MSFLDRMKAGRRIGVVAVLAAALGGAFACTASREDVMFQVGDYIFRMLVDQSGTAGIPEGSQAIDDFAVSSVTDTTPTDAFGRATGTLGFFNDNNAFGFTAYSLAPLARNGSTDPRLPALADADAAIGSFCVLGSPPFAGVGPGAWDLYCDLTNLNPSTRYTVMMVRYGLTVNTELDASAVLLDESVTAADALTPVGGTPAGYWDVPCTFSFLTPIIRDANPFVLGYVDTDASGNTTIDCIPYSEAADPTWWRNDVDALPAGVEDSIPFGPNTGADGIDLSIPSYNYLVLVEGQGTAGNPVPAGSHAMRWQVGNDIDASNVAVNNGLAPYPDYDIWSTLTKAEILALPCCTGVPSELTFTFGNLAELVGSVYQVWLYNAETGTMFSPTGDWWATVPDSAGNPVGVDSATNVQTFSSMPGWSHTFKTSAAQAGQSVGEYTHVFLSMESSAATSPSDVQPLWAQYTEMNGAPTDPFQWVFTNSGPMDFGTFNASTDPVAFDPVPWAPVGVGEGGFWGSNCVDTAGSPGSCDGTTDLMLVVYRNLQVPPTGYFYGAWLQHSDGSWLYAGDLLNTFDEGYQSLRDLDVDQSLTEWVNPQGLLLVSEQRTTLADLGGGQFYDYLLYRLTLAPKDGTSDMPPTAALGGEIPEPVRKRKPAPSE